MSLERFDPDNPACWTVLRRALLLGWRSGTDQTKILRESGATSGLPSLSRFIDGRSSVLKDHPSAEHLWNWCAGKGFIEQAEKAIADDTPDRALAAALQRFYRTHASQMDKLAAADVGGFYFGYKLAFRHPDFMVRSIWHLVQPDNHPYLLANEFQYSSGHYEADKAPREERSSGTVISKSERLWLTLREHEYEQPRFICLDTINKAVSHGDHGKDAAAHISGMSGHVLEATRKGQHLTFHSPVLLLRAENQRADLMDYRKDVDILPLERWKGAAKRFAIPPGTYQRILDFLRGKKPFFDPNNL